MPAQKTASDLLFVDVERETLYSSKSFCRWLGVSTATFWRWCNPPPGATWPALPTVKRAGGGRKTSKEAYHRWLKAQNP